MICTSCSSTSEGRDGALRLLVTSTSRSWGGMEHYAVDVARGLRERGHAVRFLWGHETVGERVRAAGLPGARLGLRADLDVLGLARLVRQMRRHRPDAVLLCRWREYWLGGLAARLARVPRTVAALGLRVIPRGDLKRRLVFHWADRVLVNAEEIADALATRPWIDASRIAVVHNGVDLARFRPGGDGARFRRELGLSPEAPLVGTIGNLTPQKDHDLLVRALAPLLAADPGLQAVIVGEGFLRPQIEDRIRALGLAGRVRLAGFRADVRPVLAALDVFVLSSANEGMAWVLLEALASGLPVVTTDVSGARACVEEGVNGRIVPAGDPVALGEAVAGLLAHPRLRAEMGRASRRLAETRFDRERMLDETERVLRG